MSQQLQPGMSWKRTAVEYAEEYGWHIVPLHPAHLSSEQQKHADPVVSQLQYQPFEGCSGGTADLQEIRAWTGMPDAVIGVRTGPESNLVALEVSYGDDAPIGAQKRRRLADHLPDTLTLDAYRDRSYFLFAYPEEGGGIDGIKRSDGLLLHGSGSTIPVPGPPSRRRRYFRWMIDTGEELASLPSTLKSLFGVDKDLDSILSEKSVPENGQEFLIPGGTNDQRQALKNTTSEEPDKSASPLPFRSGQELRGARGASTALPFSWLADGALSVLSGPPKMGGKSTFVANLATHIASGNRFLGKEPQARPVVLLSDLPPPCLDRIISEVAISRDALSRLHVLHSRDVTETHWRTLLENVFEHGSRIGAALVIIDSLDQFVEAKSGLDAVSSPEVTFSLTAESPTDCATLAVKAIPAGPAAPMTETIQRLGMLGANADLVARMDAPPAGSSHPTLRRLQFRGRLANTPSHILCEMVRGRYKAFRADAIRGARSYGGPSSSAQHCLANEEGAPPQGHALLEKKGHDRQGNLGLPMNGYTNGAPE